VKKSLAKTVCKALLDCSGKLDSSVLAIERVCGEEFLSRYRRQVGQILGLFYIEILRGVFLEHPDLEPESMRSNAPEGATSRLVADVQSDDPWAAASGCVDQAREGLKRLRETLLASQAEVAISDAETIGTSVGMVDELLEALAAQRGALSH